MNDRQKRERGREGEREGGRERGREGVREGMRERGREGGRKSLPVGQRQQASSRHVHSVARAHRHT